MKLTISWPGSGEAETSTTLAELIVANADTIADDPQWIVDVVAALDTTGSYAGGGGAAAEYCLHRVEDAEDRDYPDIDQMVTAIEASFAALTAAQQALRQCRQVLRRIERASS